MIKRLANLALAMVGMVAALAGPVYAQQTLGAQSQNDNLLQLELTAISIGGGTGNAGGTHVPGIPVASAIAPGLALMPGSTCVLAKTASGGLQLFSFGASAGFGATTPYEECNIQYNIRMFMSMPPTMVLVIPVGGRNLRINAHVLAGYMAGQLTGTVAAATAYLNDMANGIAPPPVTIPAQPQQGGPNNQRQPGPAAGPVAPMNNDAPNGMVWKCYNPRDQATCGYVPAGPSS